MSCPFILPLHRLPFWFWALATLFWAHTFALAARFPSENRPKTSPSGPEKRPSPTSSATSLTAEQIQNLIQKVRKSVVVISHHDRKGQADGVGAGFVIPGDRLVATSLHVIGEGREVSIQTEAGETLEWEEVVAWDRHFDLAILRVRGRLPPPLELGERDAILQGADVVVVGNPLGFEHSVVRGVVSALREIEGVNMLQMAVPIEPGNSGGPVVDLQGRVHGVVTLKSATAANVGFAVPVAALKKLLELPSPVSRDVWLNLGVMDPELWQTVGGARWRQRVDRIVVEGHGEGFGGRTLCLSRKLPGAGAYEVRVQLKLADEAGAAGLVFGSDGGHVHYGFYPSAGQLRLTRFDGPDVFSWSILKQDASPSYRSGEWNEIKVRMEKGRVICWVNGEWHGEQEVDGEIRGQVGLCQFRGTGTEFKQFEVGAQLSGGGGMVDAELKTKLELWVAGRGSVVSSSLIEEIQKGGEPAQRYLSLRVRELEKQAEAMRKMSKKVHAREVQESMSRLLNKPEAEVDLLRAALVVARQEEEDLDVEAYVSHVDSLARRFRQANESATDPEQRLVRFKEFFFKQQGFHGSRQDYYDRANSYMNQVVDHREGIPITLSVLFLEMGRRAGVTGLSGHPLPGHFMVRHRGVSGPGGKEKDRLIDVFNGGVELTHAEADVVAERHVEEGVRSEGMEPATPRETLARMIRNLVSIARSQEDGEETSRWLDLLLVVQPEAALERMERARWRTRVGDREGARADIRWLIDHGPPGLNRERLEELLSR